MSYYDFDIDNGLKSTYRTKCESLKMTPGEYECERIIKEAQPGDIVKLTSENSNLRTKFAYIESYEKTTYVTSNPLEPSYSKSLCVFAYGCFINIENNFVDGHLVIKNTSRIPIDLDNFKVEKCTFEEFVEFYRKQYIEDIKREKKNIRETLRNSRKNIKEKKALLKLLNS